MLQDALDECSWRDGKKIRGLIMASLYASPTRLLDVVNSSWPQSDELILTRTEQLSARALELPLLLALSAPPKRRNCHSTPCRVVSLRSSFFAIDKAQTELD
jgi:hypothetical protein